MAKQLVFTDEARTTLKQGIDAIVDAVNSTLGAGHIIAQRITIVALGKC